MKTCDNAMRRQVYSLVELIKEQYEDLEPKIREIFSTPEMFSMQKLVLTGCGDSFTAAIAVKEIFEKFTNLDIEVVSAINLARHYSVKKFNTSPNNPFIIAISNSGEVARVAEGVLRAKKLGSLTLGITGNSNSALARNSNRILKLNIPKFESSPGIRSYMVSLISLVLIAIRIGEVRGIYTMNQANQYRKGLLNLSDLLKDNIELIDEQIFNIAKRFHYKETFDFIGSGSDYAAAWYGYCKILEASGDYAMCINTEEWLHLNFFAKNPEKIGTVLIVNSHNTALSRAKELIYYALEELERDIIIISDLENLEISRDNLVLLPKTEIPELSIFVNFIPNALLAGYISKLNDDKYSRGIEGKWSFAKDGAAVVNSEIIILED